MAGLRSRWQKSKRPLSVIVIIAVSILLVVLIVVEVSLYGTGFAGKTLFDWLNLLGVLAIPVIVGLGTLVFTTRQTQISEENRKQQHETDLQITEKQQQQAFLETYFDKMSEMLLEKGLRNSKPDDEIRHLAQARTLSALHRLDAVPNSTLLDFLFGSDLLRRTTDTDIINLQYANLSKVKLERTDLHEAKLQRANLFNADLHEADLHEAKLQGANLCVANLTGANLTGADLEGADLHGADLRGANLSGATLKGAVLREAKYNKRMIHEGMYKMQPTQWPQEFVRESAGLICVDC